MARSIPTVLDTARLAIRMHGTARLDRGGRLFIGHPLRVARRAQTNQERRVALLHDTLEDTPLTAAVLARLGYPKNEIAAIEALTRQPKERYFDYIARVATNPLARRVKVYDLRDNMRPATFKGRDGMVKRYVKALRALGEEP